MEGAIATAGRETKHYRIIGQTIQLVEAVDRLDHLLTELTRGPDPPKEPVKEVDRPPLSIFLDNHSGQISEIAGRINSCVDNLREALL